MHTPLSWAGPMCGLLPIGGSCAEVWTSGLRWNLHGERLGFGGLVSSSNMLTEGATEGSLHEVTVTTSDPLVWTTMLRPEGWPRTLTELSDSLDNGVGDDG